MSLSGVIHRSNNHIILELQQYFSNANHFETRSRRKFFSRKRVRILSVSVSFWLTAIMDSPCEVHRIAHHFVIITCIGCDSSPQWLQIAKSSTIIWRGNYPLIVWLTPCVHAAINQEVKLHTYHRNQPLIVWLTPCFHAAINQQVSFCVGYVPSLRRKKSKQSSSQIIRMYKKSIHTYAIKFNAVIMMYLYMQMFVYKILYKCLQRFNQYLLL
jgi:hypothetical protein